MRLDRDEIKAQLEGLSSDKCAAFALRCAMRVLPVLATHEQLEIMHLKKHLHVRAFWFWPKKFQTKYLLSVYQSYAITLNIIIFKNKIIATNCNDESGVVTQYVDLDLLAALAGIKKFKDTPYMLASNPLVVIVNAAKAALESIRAAMISVDILSDTSAADAAASTSQYAFLAASTSASSITQEIKEDLVTLNKQSVIEFLSQPLWSHGIPKDFMRLTTDFRENVLSLNVGFEVWLDWYEQQVHNKKVDIEFTLKMCNIPYEIQSQGAAKVNAYLKNLIHKTATQKLNRVRAIFIGYGEAGKTTLIHALHNEPIVEGKEAMTAGVEIRLWDVPDTEIKAHFWDFGGQVMAHSSHQFFLRERCLYVLVLNGRSEINGTEQAEYWLEHVKSFGKNAPVMLVGNKADEAELNLDMSYLKEKYPNILAFYSLSSTKATASHFKAKFDSFKQDFCQQLQRVGTHQMLFTKEQFGVLEELRHYSPQSAFLPHEQFNTLCEKHGVSTEGELNREWLLDLLDKLGVIIHFPQLTFLEDYVLNPRWLTHGVYTLMYEQRAQLTEADAITILRDKPISDEQGNILDYPKAKCGFILKAMQKFKLSYPLVGHPNTFIIPELLPTDKPENIPFKKQGAIVFEFNFTGFLPRHILPQLIVGRHHEIIDQIVWKHGVLLQHQSTSSQALIEVSYHDRTINISVQGRDAKDYLAILNDDLLTIMRQITLDYERLIELPLSACINQDEINNTVEKVDYLQLLNHVRNNEYKFHGKYNVYDLNQVVGVIIPTSEIGNINIDKLIMSKQEIKIENSTIHGPVVAAESIKKSFKDLQTTSVEPETKALLEQLLNEIKSLNAKIPDDQAQTLEKMAKRANNLVIESQSEEPDQEWYALSLKDIKDAAITIGDIAKPVLEIAEKLSPLLLG